MTRFVALFLIVLVMVTDGLYSQDSLNVSFVGRWEGSPSYAVATDGQYVYRGSGGYLEIFDVQNPMAPLKIGYVITPDVVNEIAVNGSYAYVADGYYLRIIDISTPASPREVGFYETPGFAEGVAVNGSYAYVADGQAGMIILQNNLSTTISGGNSKLPQEFALQQNYPNPFNPATTIEYRLPVAEEVQLTIYNLSGRTVAYLVNQKQPAGVYRLKWDGRNGQGETVTSGVYFYHLRGGSKVVETRKMLLLR